MIPRREPENVGCASFWADKPSGVQENTAAKVAEAEAAAKAGELQAAPCETGEVCAEDAQADLNAIARMASEGGPSC